jgi:monofunctional biosynthetic peptidoglycan transglycosylase
MLLFDFSEAGAADGWRVINDTVMGGVSESRFEAEDGHAVFAGTVSLDRGGGFASVRAPEGPYDCTGAAAFRLAVRGDGKTYKVTAYTEPGGRVSYRAPVEPGAPDDGWATVTVPFATLTPYVRGRERPDAPAFAPARLRTVGLLIGDEQAGPFRLALRRWEAVSDVSREA